LQLGPAMKLCPGCGRLVFAEELNRLAGAAEAAANAGQPAEALQNWRQALDLLPENSVQAAEVRQRIDALVKVAGANLVLPGRPKPQPNPITGKLGMIGAFGLMVWKFKWLLAMVLTKGKLLLFGLTKVSTLATMGIWVLAYATLLGWKFALGLAIVIYIHEMGHVFALKRLGIQADAPIFIPGLGALVRLRQTFVNPIEDATIGLAGPLWGLATAVATAGLYAWTGYPLFAALTQVGAWINLFNLLPISPLDGGRGFRALSHGQRWLLMLVMGAALMASGEGMLILILIVGVLRTLAERSTATTVSWKTFGQFAVLIVALTALAKFHDPGRTGIIPTGFAPEENAQSMSSPPILRFSGGFLAESAPSSGRGNQT
jgi:Zn-dependent protease